MSITTKPPTKLDYEQALQGSYNDVNSTLSVDGFLTGKVGHKVVRTTPSGSVEVYSFYDNSTLLYEITITYTSSTKEEISVVERTA